MADHTKIEWTDATWNPITGCSVLSPGCTNCYAMKLAGTRMKNHPSRAGLTIDTKAGTVWNGEVRFNEEWLTQPLQWKKPRMIFVCAHADLFHESVPDAWIDRVFAVMALAPQHTFQVLTKRSKRMREYITEHGSGFGDTISVLERVADKAGRMMEDGDNAADCVLGGPWPLPNVWLGVSVEDQKRADERIPNLLATPAAIRWISAEPLLGPVNLRDMDINDHLASRQLGLIGGYWINALTGANDDMGRPCPDVPKIDWVVVGGESGANARPMHPDWARSLRDQCAAAGVPFLFKQWGEWLPFGQSGFTAWHASPSKAKGKWWGKACFNDGAGGPNTQIISRVETLIVGDRGQQVVRLGKGRAGRLLDGVEHNGYPEIGGALVAGRNTNG